MEYTHEQGMKGDRWRTAVGHVNMVILFFWHSVISLLSEMMY